MSDGVTYLWREPISDEAMVALVKAHGGRAEVGWWDRVSPHSLGWVTARSTAGLLVGFVNIAWDGADHAFLLDTKTHSDWQHRGVGTELARRAGHHAREAGCEWLHVDFGHELTSFYLDACGFDPTDAGLIHLPTSE